MDTPSTFKEGTDFKDALELYRFDDELRDILFSLIGRIEIKLRARIDQVVSEHTDDPFWYLNDDLFDTYKINGLRSQLLNVFTKAKDEFTTHYKSKYFNESHADFKSMPPFWMVSEIMTFGNILSIYKAIEKVPFNTLPSGNKLDNLAKEFGATNLKSLNSWLTLIRDIRNRCAHHSRTWNANYREPLGIRQQLDPTITLPTPNRIYFFLALLHLMSKSLSLNTNIRETLTSLIEKYPAINTHLEAAGFPSNWESDSFWD